MTRLRPWARPALTLLEVVLAMGILVFLSSMTYWFYASVLETSREGTGSARNIRLVRVILDRMAKEIRQAAVLPIDNAVGIRGDAEQIWLSSFRVPSREQSKERSLRDLPRPGEYDVTKVEYKIVRHPEILHDEGYEISLGLARIEKPIPRPDHAAMADLLSEGESDGQDGGQEGGESDGEEGGELGDEGLDVDATEQDLRERLAAEEALEDGTGGDASLAPDIRWDQLYAPEIRYMRFCYYDGNQWWDSWDVVGESPLPQLVRVAIGFEPYPPFGEARELNEPNEEFCKCLNEDPVDCDPLPEDQYTITVRVPQADPLFRSRVNRESQAFVAELLGDEEDEEEE